MVKRELDEIKARCEAAGCRTMVVNGREAILMPGRSERIDAIKIVMEDVPRLLAEVERLLERVAELEAGIRNEQRAHRAHEAGQQALERQVKKQTATAERLCAVLEGLAEGECSYGDNCPAFGSRHGQCYSCRAREAIRGEEEDKSQDVLDYEWDDSGVAHNTAEMVRAINKEECKS